jgi:hypothetical protein
VRLLAVVRRVSWWLCVASLGGCAPRLLAVVRRVSAQPCGASPRNHASRLLVGGLGVFLRTIPSFLWMRGAPFGCRIACLLDCLFPVGDFGIWTWGVIYRCLWGFTLSRESLIIAGAVIVAGTCLMAGDASYVMHHFDGDFVFCGR